MVAVFGPNASGKTTLVRALTNLKNMLRLENGGLRKGLLPFNPFAFGDGSDQPTLYHIVFTKDHVLFDYLLMFNQDAITYESLHYAPKGRRKLVFERSENHYTFGAFPERTSSF
jgi:energy-coupling factor transporter ATP-binding protein EcfA2